MLECSFNPKLSIFRSNYAVVRQLKDLRGIFPDVLVIFYQQNFFHLKIF